MSAWQLYYRVIILGVKNTSRHCAEYPNVAESLRFAFVPGPADPGSAIIYPRPPSRMEGNNVKAKMGEELSQCTPTDSNIKP